MRLLSLLLTTISIGNTLPKPLSHGGQWLVLITLLLWLCGVRYMPSDRVGLVESLRQRTARSSRSIPAQPGATTTYQSRVLRPGLHFRLWPWQYRVQQVPQVHVPPGTVAYVYPRAAAQRDVDSPLAILDAGTYPVHLVDHFVVTRDRIYSAWLEDDDAGALSKFWQRKLHERDAFRASAPRALNATTPPDPMGQYLALREKAGLMEHATGRTSPGARLTGGLPAVEALVC